MKMSRPRAWMLWTLVSEMLCVPVFYIAWWLNAEGLELPGDPNPLPFSASAIFSAELTLVAVFAIVALISTTLIIWLIQCRRRWRLLSAYWIWGTGLWAPFLLVSLGKPQLYFHDSFIDDIVGVAFIAILTTLIPLVVGGLLAIGYWIVSLILIPDRPQHT